MADQPNSIFEGNKEQVTPEQNNSVISNNTNVSNENDLTNLLQSIKNERGEAKYKTLEEALNGLKHAQEYIPTIKNELSQKEQEIAHLREQAIRNQTLEQTIEALTSKQNQQQQTAPVEFDEKKVAELVERTLTVKQKQQVSESNLKSVVTTLQQSFGADAEKKFYDKAEELGLSKEEINSLAAKSPSAVLTMFGIKGDVQQKSIKPFTGTVNSDALQPQNNTLVGRNKNPFLSGASTQQLKEETFNVKSMVEELHKQGLSVHDLTDPKQYQKYFKK